MERFALNIAAMALSLSAWNCGDGPQKCESTVDCSGSFCVDGICRSECDPAAPACDDGICTSNGRCARDQPDPDAGICAAMVLEAEFGTPTVVLLVDQSGSMDDPYPGGTRWTVLRDALIDPTNGVIANLQDSIRFGLTLYSHTGGPTCPELTVVDPAISNLGPISTEYQVSQPLADTPTGESISAVVQRLSAFSEPGSKFIVVATDGEPDTCLEPNPQNGQPEAIAATQAAYAMGIKLFILSVGVGDISAAHLQDMANAGAGLAVGGIRNAPYYEAGDSQQLDAAFAAITGQVLSCQLNVNGEINPGVETGGTIYLDGNRLEVNASNGWEPIDSTSFRLVGNACDLAQRSGSHVVTAEFGCTAPLADPGLEITGGGLAGGCACSSNAPGGWLLLVGLGWLCRRRPAVRV